MSRSVKCLCVVAAAVILCAGAAPGRKLPREHIPQFTIPRMKSPPTIDGEIGEKEWRESVAIGGPVNQANNILIPRPTTFYLAWDAGHFYMAVRTYIRPNYKPRIRDGRSDGQAYVFDDGLELHFKPKGQNVPAENKKNSYKLFLNCLGHIGDTSRLAMGQQFKNWNPKFNIKTRLTEPGTAPNGGRWWELELASVPKDFELNGPHHAGDRWKLMLGINHIPSWMQARIPAVGSYLDPFGYPVGVLVEDTPAVQFTMNSLSNLARDGTASMSIEAYNPTDATAEVKVDLAVADAISRLKTLAIEPGKTAKWSIDKKLPDDVKSGPVDLSVTEGDTKLLTYYSFFKVGAYSHMLNPVKPRPDNKFAFETNYNPVRNNLLIKGDTYYLDDPESAEALIYRVYAKGEDEPIVEDKITRSAEWYLQEVVELPELDPGQYRIEATMKLADREIGPMQAGFTVKDEAEEWPEWWNRDYGDTDQIIYPFSPIESVDRSVPGEKDKRDGFSCWGRDYVLNAMGLPDAVYSQGEEVLAEPARIVVERDGREHAIALGRPTITEHEDYRVRFKGQAEGAGLQFTATGWLEQDGLVYIDLTYAPAGEGPVEVDGLRIEFPVSERDADSLLCVGPGENYSSRTTMLLPDDRQGRLWSTLDTGITGSNMTVGSFYPTMWIGSERRGFLWWADTDRGWVPKDEVPAHEAVRRGGSVVLINNIIGTSYRLDEARTISLSYNASPFRPLPDGWRMAIATEDGTFFQPFRGVRKDSKTGEKVKQGHGHVNWIHPESRYPEEWGELWAEQKKKADAHARRYIWRDPFKAQSGINFTHMSFQLMGYGDKTLEKDILKYFGPEWKRDTWNETYIDYAMYLFDRAFGEGGVRSTYWDLTFPRQFNNLQSGLAYRLPDGRVQPGYNGWNIRRFFMRLYALMDRHDLVPGANGAHSTNAYVTVALPWLDAVLDGERNWDLDTSPLDWVDTMPINRMRAMSDPHNWGTAICWMSNYTADDRTDIKAAKVSQAEYVWMYDTWRNPYLGPGPRQMPQSILEWGLNGPNVAYHPFWRNPYARSNAEDILVTLWRLPSEGRAMVGIFNYNTDTTLDARVEVDMEKLGLADGEAVGRLLYNQSDADVSLDPADGRIAVNGLPTHRGVFVGLGSTKTAALTRAKTALPKWVKGGLPQSVVDYGLVRANTAYIAPGKAPGVSCADESIRIGMWRLPDRVLLTVFNAGGEKKNAAMEVDLESLGLKPTRKWTEFVRVRQLYPRKGPRPSFNYYKGRLAVKGIPPKAGRLVVIRRY